jgi:hypothetical protein
MSNITKVSTTVGGQPAVLLHISHKQEEQVKEEVSVDSLHFIEIVDRSYSMSGNLRELGNHVYQSTQAMGPNDRFSLIWFAGEGQYRTVFKGAKRDDEGLRVMIDEIISPVGLTCFSESLQEAEVIMKELAKLCPNFVLGLFTDGEPVVSWGAAEEMKRCLDIAARIGGTALALNCIGYGYNYDMDFLKGLSAKTQFGQAVHSSKIEDFTEIFRHNYERVSDLVVDTLDVVGPSCDDIVYIGSKNSKLTVNKLGDGNVNRLHLTALDKRKNQVLLVLRPGGDGKVNGLVEYNGATIDVNSLKEGKLREDTLRNALYAYAHELYYAGRRQEALDVLAHDLGDRFLVDSQFQAFTRDEVAEHSAKLRKAAFDTKARFLGGTCSKDYLPAADAPCVYGLLRTLAASSRAWYLPDEKGYKRIGLKAVDSYNLFKADVSHVPMAPFSDLVFNEEHLNVSLRWSKQGTVAINPRTAERVGLPTDFPTQIYRVHTVVKDGELHTPRIWAVVGEDVMEILDTVYPGIVLKTSPSANVDRNDFKGKDGSVEAGFDVPYHDVFLDLSVLPVINRSYLESSRDTRSVLAQVVHLNELKAEQKVLKHYLKAMTEATNVAKDRVGGGYNKEQMEVLLENGLDYSLNYSGVKREVEKKNEEDFYEIRTLTLQLAGWSSLPKVEDVIASLDGVSGKKLNGPGTQMAKIIEELRSEEVALDKKPTVEQSRFIEGCLRTVKNSILRTSADLAAMKLAKVLTGDWFDGAVPNDKGQYVFASDIGGVERQLVIKAGREKQYFS